MSTDTSTDMLTNMLTDSDDGEDAPRILRIVPLGPSKEQYAVLLNRNDYKPQKPEAYEQPVQTFDERFMCLDCPDCTCTDGFFGPKESKKRKPNMQAGSASQAASPSKVNGTASNGASAVIVIESDSEDETSVTVRGICFHCGFKIWSNQDRGVVKRLDGTQEKVHKDCQAKATGREVKVLQCYVCYEPIAAADREDTEKGPRHKKCRE